MNERATASVSAITEALPLGMGDDLLLLSIFGSQVKGTERPDSDLDILYVAKTSKASHYDAIHDTATISGGIAKATVIPHGPDTIARMANVYGSVEWGVLREDGARTLYRSADFDVPLHPDIDYDYSAGRWLDMARKYIFPEGGYSEPRPGFTSFRLNMVLGILLRANLMSARVKFPFTRDVRVLYEMLPRERRPPLDVEAVESILARYKEDDDEENWSPADALAVTHMAKQAYDFTSKLTKPIEAA